MSNEVTGGEKVVVTEKKAVISFDSRSVQTIIFLRLMRPPAHAMVPPGRTRIQTEDIPTDRDARREQE